MMGKNFQAASRTKQLVSGAILFSLLALAWPFVAVNSQNGGFTAEDNTDRPGADYKDFDLSQPNWMQCRDACANDGNCRAYTYVRPGVQGPNARCWLKSSVPASVSNNCCISGAKGGGGGGGEAGWTKWQNRDTPGDSGDWEIDLPCPSPKAIQCRAVNGRDWTQTGQRYKCSLDAPNPGGVCLNADNPQGCLDYEVRFRCN